MLLYLQRDFRKNRAENRLPLKTYSFSILTFIKVYDNAVDVLRRTHTNHYKTIVT